MGKLMEIDFVTELLRREDETIMAAIRRKQQIVANLLHIPQDQFENIAELAGETGTSEKEQTELALACFHHGQLTHTLKNKFIFQLIVCIAVTRLTTMLNESLRITEEDSITASASSASARYPPTVNLHFVQEVSSALSSHITELLVRTHKNYHFPNKCKFWTSNEIKRLIFTIFCPIFVYVTNLSGGNGISIVNWCCRK
jgi:hypothetical protein